MKPALLIMAAGLGSRYGGLKQMEGIGPRQEIMMDYSIHDAQKAGFGKAVLIVQEQMIPILTERYRHLKKFPIEYAVQGKEITVNQTKFISTKPWGTAHALWCAKNHIEGNFLSINADDFYGQSSFQLAFDHLTQKNRPCAILYPILKTLSESGTVNRAEVNVDNKLVVDSVEREKIRQEHGAIVYPDNQGVMREIKPNALVSMNMWGFTPLIFKYIDKDIQHFIELWKSNNTMEYQLPKVVSSMIKRNLVEVDAIATQEEWIGITYQSDKEIAANKLNALHHSGIYSTPLWTK